MFLWFLKIWQSVLSFIISSCLGVFCCWQSQHCPLSYHPALVSSVVDKVSTVLYHIIMPWCLLLLTKSALSFIISSCLGVFSVLLTKSALSFIISSCLGVFCCLQSQHCPLSYHLALVSSVIDKVSTVLYHIILPWCLLLLTKSALSFIISSCLGVFCCWQSQHCPLSYHLVLVSSVVYKVSIVLYNIILPWCLLLLTKSALSFIISSCLGVFCCWQSQHCPLSYHLALVSSVVDKVSTVLYHIILPWCLLLLTKSALSFIISSCLGVFCCWQSQHCPLSYHPALVSSVVDKVSTVLYHIIMPWCLLSVVDKVSTALYHIIMPWCLLLFTKSALSFIISSCLGVFCYWQSQHCPLSYHPVLVSSVVDKVSTVLYHIILPWCLQLLTKSALSFIISSCLGVFSCWQSQHCPLSYHHALVSSVVYKVSTVLYHIILSWCLLLFTKSALSFIISSCLGVFCCWQSQHCPLSYHPVLVSSVVYKVSTVLYHIILPWCLLLLTKSALSFIISSCLGVFSVLLTKSALSFIISSCLGVFSVLLTKSALSFIISSCLGVFCCVQSKHCPL